MIVEEFLSLSLSLPLPPSSLVLDTPFFLSLTMSYFCCFIILYCREVIVVNQDSLGTQGRLIDSVIYTDRYSGERIAATSNMVFARSLNDSSVAVALLNTGHFAEPHNITVNFQKVSMATRQTKLQYPCMMISFVNVVITEIINLYNVKFWFLIA